MVRLGLLSRLRQSESGVAAVELAISMPFILVLLLGGSELCRYMLIQQKVEKMSFTSADVISQYESVTSAEVAQVVIATEQIMKPFTFGSRGVLILSSVHQDPATRQQTVRWQCRSSDEFDAKSKVGVVDKEATLPGGFLLDDRDNVIISEVFYRYDPLIKTYFGGSVVVYRTGMFRPRLGALTSAPGC